MPLPSIIFVQDLLRLSNSFKDSRIGINRQEMGSFESNKLQSSDVFQQATTQNLKTTGSLGIKFQTSTTADTITKSQKKQ